MKKLGVVITDGVGFRNFILSDFCKESQKTFDEVVILSFLPASIYKNHTTAKVIALDAMEESYKTWIFRKAKEVAHLRQFKKGNFGINDSYEKNKSQKFTTRGIGIRLVYGLTKFFNSEKWIQTYNKLQQKTFGNSTLVKEYTKIVQREKIDLLFFTHQRPPYIAPLVLVAEILKIKTVSFIFSWDNLASKGRMAANFDYYLVWSELMKTELLQFYKAVTASEIFVVGTPQFEPYVLERYFITEKNFRRKFDLDASKKIICFSCGDISTSKNDELYIHTIAKGIQQNKIQNAQLLIRSSPAEDPIRFESFAAKYPFIKWNYPDWNVSRKEHQESWSQRVPSVEDLKDLRAILNYSDLNVNMLSTMSLDFMQFDKPVINPLFGNGKNGLYDDQRFLKYAHIEHLINSGATKVVLDENTLITALNTYLSNPEIDSENRKFVVNQQVGGALLGTGKRIAATLIDLL